MKKLEPQILTICLHLTAIIYEQPCAPGYDILFLQMLETLNSTSHGPLKLVHENKLLSLLK